MFFFAIKLVKDAEVPTSGSLVGSRLGAAFSIHLENFVMEKAATLRSTRVIEYYPDESYVTNI